ncbi:hypothetical protein IW262DRAFT_1295527 [Armillaria fumosa]|nr:hypothetical protein IW262DRAFT_1295527 [Armillaria fumosa]
MSYYPPQGPPPGQQGGYYPQGPPQGYDQGQYGGPPQGYQPQPQPQTVIIKKRRVVVVAMPDYSSNNMSEALAAEFDDFLPIQLLVFLSFDRFGTEGVFDLRSSVRREAKRL